MRAFLVLLLAFAGVVLAAPPRPLPGELVPFQSHFLAVAGPRWIDRAAQARAESAFNPQAVSPVGARGIAQFMPATWKEWAPRSADPFDPLAGILAQHRYMAWLEARTSGLDPALGSYNAGLGNIRKAQKLADALGLTDHAAWLRTLPRVTGPAHAGETRGYIEHNAAYRAAIRAQLTR